MSDFPFSIFSKKDKVPTTSQGTRSFSWASINYSQNGIQSLNFHMPQERTIPEKRNNIAKTMHGKFFQDKEAKSSATKVSPADTLKQQHAQRAPYYTKSVEKEKANKNPKSDLGIKQRGSLPNLLMLPTKKENSSIIPDSPQNKGQIEQIRRVAYQIDSNFRFKPGHLNQAPGGRKDMHSFREKVKVEHGESIVISARMENTGRNTINASFRKSSVPIVASSDRRSASPGQSSIRYDEDRVNVMDGKAISSLKAFVNQEEDIGRVSRSQKIMSQRSVINISGIQMNETHNLIKGAFPSARPKTSTTDSKLLRNQSMQKLGSQKSSLLLDSKVTEEQRERLALFLKDEFVNDLIFTKYYQVMDEEDKTSALNNLKKMVSENKIIREKFNHTTNGSHPNFFEQFNNSKKWIGNSPHNRSRSGLDFLHPSNGQNVHGFEQSAFEDSPIEEVRSGISSHVENSSPRQGKIKDADYYVNLELTKGFNTGESKKKNKKKKVQKIWTKDVDDKQKERFSRIRKWLKEKLLKFKQFKFTPEEIMSNMKLFPSKPFERQGSYAFLKAAKYEDDFTITQYLEQDRFYVFEYDAIKQTALHYATKKGHLNIVKILLDHGSDVDAVDLGGRTPLYYALREGHSEIVRILLISKASPWSIRGFNYKESCKDQKSLHYLSKARQLSIILKFFKSRERAEIWEREVARYLLPVATDRMERLDLKNRLS